jgi:hypothetical protein
MWSQSLIGLFIKWLDSMAAVTSFFPLALIPQQGFS